MKKKDVPGTFGSPYLLSEFEKKTIGQNAYNFSTKLVRGLRFSPLERGAGEKGEGGRRKPM